ncbi:MAG TPA: phenylacetate--CoA ligase family protein, partial [Planctomycetota bacterium]|nr:phenylacetate--CoA ligase family protein [Planctomycetota bacterium]
MTWPPRPDPDSRPPADAEYWAPDLERLPPAAREAVILAKLTAQVQWAWERSPFYRRRWQAAGVSPATLKRLDDLRR